MRTKEQVLGIVEALENEYPDALCSLQYEKDYELLFSVRLAAQCTDERVNMITPALFARFPTLEDFAGADVAEVEEYIHSCGFFRAKARDIVLCAQMLLERFGGKVPGTMEELLTLPGVGRKTANVVQAIAFDKPAIAVDTHVFRVSHRLGLVHASANTPYKVEMELKKNIPTANWAPAHFWLLYHGRYTCTALHPKCSNCGLKQYCCKKD